MRKVLFILLSLLSLQTRAATLDNAKPWTFWYWMYGAVSKEGIHADLQGMHDIGLGGCYLMPIRGVNEHPEYDGQAQQLSKGYWDMIDYAFQQADSLGLQMGIHISDGFALAGGPWIKPEESMQHVVWTDTIVNSAKCVLRKPCEYYEDIACYAIPARYEEIKQKPKVTYSTDVARDKNGTYRASQPCWIQYEYTAPVTVRNIGIVTSGTNIQGERLLVETSNDGINFTKARQLTQPRQGWQSYLFDTINYALQKTEARFFRFSWTPEGSEPGSEDLDAAKWKPNLKVKDIILSSEPRISEYLIKSGALWGIADKDSSTDIPNEDCIRLKDVVHLTLADNKIITPLPKGRWHILRMGHASTGMTNATAGGGKGLECDKFSPAAINKQVDNWFGKHKERKHADVVKFLHVDSWECGSQNWGYQFAEEFKIRRGYDIFPYLPVMAGIPIESAEKSERVLKDIRLTINDLINEKFFKTVAQRAKGYGVQISSESVAPTMVCDGMEHYKYVDLPMGEFWLNSPTHDKPNDMLDAIHGAYLYGKNIVQAEGLTEVRGTWNETPSMVKPLIDRNFALGTNRLFFHVNVHNPWLNRHPGMTLDGIGFFFQRDNTWYKEAKNLVDYVTRCQKLLQEGSPVFDIPVYCGDEMPRRAVLPNRLIDIYPSAFSAEAITKEKKRRANIGQPMEESPVGVNHQKNILRAEDFTNPLQGLKYYTTNKPTRILTLPEKDIELPKNVDYIHRKSSSRDIYFITNQSGKAMHFMASFRTIGRKPYFYDAVTDMSFLPDSSFEKQGRSYAHIDLPAEGSIFVIFDKNDYINATRVPKLRATDTNLNHWKVSFENTNVNIMTDTLFDWSLSNNPQIKYYSGHATYETKFRYHNKISNQVTLNLGTVKDIATVYINGINCGTIWTEPYEVNVTKAIKKGKNTLRIVVVNTWANALLGNDMGIPPFNNIWTNAKYRKKEAAPISAGLIGPIIIKE